MFRSLVFLLPEVTSTPQKAKPTPSGHLSSSQAVHGASASSVYFQDVLVTQADAHSTEQPITEAQKSVVCTSLPVLCQL